MLSFRLLKPDEKEIINTIANWYKQEWNIPLEKTIYQLSDSSAEKNIIFQLLTFENDELISTGGVYKKVGIHKVMPIYFQQEHWLALMYTKPNTRGKGRGVQMLREIEKEAKERGVKTLYLFTDTATSFYERSFFQVEEKITTNNRTLVVMQKTLLL